MHRKGGRNQFIFILIVVVAVILSFVLIHVLPIPKKATSLCFFLFIIAGAMIGTIIKRLLKK